MRDLPGHKMIPTPEKTSFLCTLPGPKRDMAYSITVGFIDPTHPNCVQFTSFVGEGRRSFRVLASEEDVPSAARCSIESLCRMAIGQVMRDSLYAMTAVGDHRLDLHAPPWEGELKPAGARTAPRSPGQRSPG